MTAATVNALRGNREYGDRKMTKWTAGAVAVAAIVAASAASAEQLAARTERPIMPVSRVIGVIEAQSDFSDYKAVHYNRASRSFEVLYGDKDGAPKLMVIDAVDCDVRR